VRMLASTEFAGKQCKHITSTSITIIIVGFKQVVSYAALYSFYIL
jgi:hypothetical protein